MTWIGYHFMLFGSLWKNVIKVAKINNSGSHDYLISKFQVIVLVLHPATFLFWGSLITLINVIFRQATVFTKKLKLTGEHRHIMSLGLDLGVRTEYKMLDAKWMIMLLIFAGHVNKQLFPPTKNGKKNLFLMKPFVLVFWV